MLIDQMTWMVTDHSPLCNAIGKMGHEKDIVLTATRSAHLTIPIDNSCQWCRPLAFDILLEVEMFEASWA
jgi:hypothetical protein